MDGLVQLVHGAEPEFLLWALRVSVLGMSLGLLEKNIALLILCRPAASASQTADISQSQSEEILFTV